MIEWKGEVLRRVPEVAAILKVTPQRVHELIRKGKLKARDVGGVRHIEEAEIDRFLGVPVTVDPVVRTTRQSQKASAAIDRELDEMGWGSPRCLRCRREMEFPFAMTKAQKPTHCLSCTIDDPDATFGKRLRILRLSAELSLAALAEQSGISRDKLNRFEKGLADPDAVQIATLTRLLGPRLVFQGGPKVAPQE